MLKFSQKNQHFSTLDLLILVVLVGGVFSIFGAVLAQGFQDNRLTRAKTSAEAYAIQIKEQRIRAHRSETRASRQPASVENPTLVGLPANGEIGRDPWGRPFHYRVIEPSENQSRRVVVWSDGPNREPESASASEGGFGEADTKSTTFGGDDVGFVHVDAGENSL